MKLRIRGANSSNHTTARIEIPADSSLHHLKHSIALAVGLPSSSSLRLSLNRTDPLTSDDSDSLLSLGISAGDLIFYSVVPGQDPAPAQVTAPNSDSETMEIDDESWRFPESCFVKRLVRVLGGDFGGIDVDRKLIICAVHSVFLESGFVGLFDLRFSSSMALSMCLTYTLPEIVEAERAKSVVLKFQFLRNFVTVYGSLVDPDSGPAATHRVCIDERRFAPSIAELCSSEEYDAEREVFGLWRIAKDGLALPLMIELCERVGLPGPPCFARLPSELQLKILELLPGADVARAGCACRELNHLARNNELWERKVAEEFGAGAGAVRMGVGAGGSPAVHWESVFVECRQSKKRRREMNLEAARSRARLLSRYRRQQQPFFGYPWVGPLNPYGLPRIGGDRDGLPGFVQVPPPMRWRGGRRWVTRGRAHPNCNLGGGGL